MRGIFILFLIVIGTSRAEAPPAYGIYQSLVPAILRIYPLVGKGQDNAYHNYFNVEFSRINGAIGYNAYVSYCKQDTCKSADTLKAARKRAPVLLTAFRISSVDSGSCSQNSCFSTGNFLSVGGTYFLKVCAVDENGGEGCSPYKAFVYKGAD
jgi:hypothetical protein